MKLIINLNNNEKTMKTNFFYYQIEGQVSYKFRTLGMCLSSAKIYMRDNRLECVALIYHEDESKNMNNIVGELTYRGCNNFSFKPNK